MRIHNNTRCDIGRTLLFLLIHTLFAIAAIAGTDSVTSYWDTGNSSDQTRVDHSQWQKFLDHYLYQTKGDRTLVDYKNVDASGYQELESYIQHLARLDPRDFNPAEQMAYWINLYNALTVKVVLDNPDKTTITKMGSGLLSFGPWNEDQLTITSQSLSLNDIEHRILRPIWKDDRIHFALNCASLGCPNLDPFVFNAGDLEERLNKARSQYLGHPRALHFDSRGILHVSSLFQWYLDDFAKDETALLLYLANHRPGLREQILSYAGDISYDYDWDLNSLSGKR